MSYIPVRKISVSLPPELLRRVDAAADYEYATRSDIIRQALVQYLKGKESVAQEGTEYAELRQPAEAEDDFTDVWARHSYVHPGDVELLRFLKNQDQGVEV